MAGSTHRYLPIYFSVLAAFLVVSVLITPGRTQSEKKSATSGQSKTYERPTDPSLYVGNVQDGIRSRNSRGLSITG
jgi:hypothetical protein